MFLLISQIVNIEYALQKTFDEHYHSVNSSIHRGWFHKSHKMMSSFYESHGNRTVRSVQPLFDRVTGRAGETSKDWTSRTGTTVIKSLWSMEKESQVRLDQKPNYCAVCDAFWQMWEMGPEKQSESGGEQNWPPRATKTHWVCTSWSWWLNESGKQGYTVTCYYW